MFAEPHRPRISVVVPAFNGASTLPSCLRALRESSYPDFEILVVDDGSGDGSADLAVPLADQVIRGDRQRGVAEARNRGARRATGALLCFVDQDVVVARDTLEKVARFFEARPSAAAVTGILSREHPNADFFSQYKNLYMNYIFSRLPDRVGFLYGSLYAVRKEAFEDHDPETLLPDTELGQRLHAAGKEVYFDRGLEVIHLKKYSMARFFRNDFFIPFVWAEVFVKHRAWKRIGSGGFAHARRGQLLSLGLACLTTLSASAIPLDRRALAPAAGALILWIALNAGFLRFLRRERGWLYSFRAWLVTFLDHHVMTAGVLCGMACALAGRRTNRIAADREAQTESSSQG
jgi:GT2 family glycosyltransferase